MTMKKRNKTASATNAPESNAMPPEIDFSGGTRGKFYRPDAKLKLPTQDKDRHSRDHRRRRDR